MRATRNGNFISFEVALQPLRILVDADEQEDDAGIVLIFRECGLQVRQLGPAGPHQEAKKSSSTTFP